MAQVKSFGLHTQMILVPMEVTRLVRFPGREFGVDIWGYVGDYEIKISRPHSDRLSKDLLAEHRALEKVLKKMEKSKPQPPAGESPDAK